MNICPALCIYPSTISLKLSLVWEGILCFALIVSPDPNVLVLVWHAEGTLELPVGLMSGPIGHPLSSAHLTPMADRSGKGKV